MKLQRISPLLAALMIAAVSKAADAVGALIDEL